MFISESAPLDVETIDFDRLDAATLAAWGELCDHCQCFAHPCYRPQFAAAIHQHRGNVRVALIRNQGLLAGVWAYETLTRGKARAVGYGISDFQAIIAAAPLDITAEQLLHACQLKSYSYDHWITTSAVDGLPHSNVRRSPYLDLSQGFEEYYRRRTATNSCRLRKTGQVTRKLEREIGPLEFCENERSDEAWSALLEWKSQQYRRTGVLDVLSYRWVKQVLQAIHREQTDNFRGCLMTLRAGGRLVAVHFGMRSGSIVHWWFPAYDAQLSRYSPGLIMLLQGAKHFADQGCTRIDMGKGDEPYKASVTADYDEVGEGVMDSRLVSKAIRGSVQQMWMLAKRLPGRELVRNSTSLLYRLKRHRDFR